MARHTTTLPLEKWDQQKHQALNEVFTMEEGACI
jgi:hypothetical protein